MRVPVGLCLIPFCELAGIGGRGDFILCCTNFDHSMLLYFLPPVLSLDSPKGNPHDPLVYGTSVQSIGSVTNIQGIQYHM